MVTTLSLSDILTKFVCLFKEINTFMQEGCIKLFKSDRKYISNVIFFK